MQVGVKGIFALSAECAGGTGIRPTVSPRSGNSSPFAGAEHADCTASTRLVEGGNRPGATMVGLTEKAFIGLLALFLVFAALLFGGAGTFEWWQAWVFLTVYFGASIALTLYLVKSDPALLGRRLRGGPWAEKQPAQRLVMQIASVAFIGLILVPGLDRRFGSHVPPAVALAGDVLVALGWLGMFLVFRENSFTRRRSNWRLIRR